MLVIDGHESHQSVEFEVFCEDKKIFTLCLASHLLQPLDIGCFSALKRAYSRQLEHFIKVHITHITKLEFFLALKAAHFTAMSEANIQGGFRGAGIVLFDPQAVISKLDVKLRRRRLLVYLLQPPNSTSRRRTLTNGRMMSAGSASAAALRFRRSNSTRRRLPAGRRPGKSNSSSGRPSPKAYLSSRHTSEQRAAETSYNRDPFSAFVNQKLSWKHVLSQ